MTGTALTEAEEFGDIYNLSVFEIPTNIPVSRIDNEDEIYRTAEEKYDAIIEQIKICNEKSQPVLVGTTSIDKSEKISKKLRNNKIKHEVLNAKHHEQEAKIIANAGEPGAVTIATSERHESRRIDNQLRGRSGRQGDPGETKFFISLEDDLMRIFGSEKIDSVLKSLGLKEGESIKHAWISKALERAQKKVEGRNFDIRKTLLKFDDVLNDQRKTIFEQRLELMNADNISEIANEMQYDVADEIVERYCPEKSYADQWNLQDLQDEINQYFSKKIDVNLENSEGDINQQYIKDKVYTLINENTVNRKGNHSEEEVNSAERMVMLKILDDKWKDHIYNLEQLRSTIGLRGYGQRDPLNEYKNEAFGLFEELINNLKIDVSKIFSRMRLREKQNQTLNENSVSEKINQSAIKTKKISRNAPCPCGSGKKYKHCCGKIN